jgi:CPA1 family monovalent cation:H+ antiporter
LDASASEPRAIRSRQSKGKPCGAALPSGGFLSRDIEWVALLLLICAIVAMLARRWRVPYTVGLLLTGVTLALLPFSPSIVLSRDLIFSGLLPPLIFEAALFLSWTELRQELPVVLTMASVGLIVAALVTAAGMHFLLAWPLLPALVFGALIAATDPVSVIATFREAGVRGRLRLLVEAESLFNDGTAAVLFGLLLVMAAGVAPSATEVLLEAVRTVCGGIFCGAAVALLVVYLIAKTDDHLVELTFTVVAAYGSFLLAEHFQVSGVLSTLAAGLVIGARARRGAVSESGRVALETFWEFAAFVANSLVFILIGMQEARQDFHALLIPSASAIVLVLFGRACAIYPVAACFARSAHALSYAEQHVMVWGGLRGALGLALALGLPADLPLRGEIVTLTFAVVAFSVLVQGLSFAPLLRRLGLLGQHPGRQPADRHHEES